MKRIAGIAPYLAFLLLVVLAVVLHRPAEADLPDHTDKAWPKAEASGLAVPASAAGRPAFRAKRATPRAGDGPITLGGWREGLALRDVVVELAPGWVLEGRAGAWVRDRLAVFDRVVVRGDGRVRLEASRVAIVDDRLQFSGAVWMHTTGGRRSVVDLSVRRKELLDRLR